VLRSLSLRSTELVSPSPIAVVRHASLVETPRDARCPKPLERESLTAVREATRSFKLPAFN
tara:strand:+ start:454 stop:636 length:183 start_codon:yes stop_codon:yes gene_type:complete